MKNLFILILLLCQIPLTYSQTSDTQNSLSWIEKIKNMDPESDELQKEIASLKESADSRSKARLGFLYLNGWGVKKNNLNNGIALNKYIQPAADQNDPFAQYLLGELYLDDFRFVNEVGDLGMFSQDWDKAMELYHKSAEAGFAPAQHVMGDIYIAEKDISKAIKWYEKAAYQQYEESIIELANIYFIGHGDTKDISKAKHWLKRAADDGSTKAEIGLGQVYFNEGEEDKALEWFQKAADKGDAEGQYNIALLYNSKNLNEQAIEWLVKAAEQGHATAALNLAQVYDSQNMKDESMKWREVAANNGHIGAARKLAEIFIESNNKGTKKIDKGLRHLEKIEQYLKQANQSMPESILYKMAKDMI